MASSGRILSENSYPSEIFSLNPGLARNELGSKLRHVRSRKGGVVKRGEEGLIIIGCSGLSETMWQEIAADEHVIEAIFEIDSSLIGKAVFLSRRNQPCLAYSQKLYKADAFDTYASLIIQDIANLKSFLRKSRYAAHSVVVGLQEDIMVLYGVINLCLTLGVEEVFYLRDRKVNRYRGAENIASRSISQL